jgi:serine/threonine-protein kinase
VIEIGTTLNQRFLLQKELGRGGMGSVYSATDQLLERKVAIKVLKEHSGEEVGKRLRLEAQIAARLLHDNVVRIYDFGKADAAYYLVMEEVTGTSFSKRWRQLAIAERLRVLALVAEALDYAHQQGVVHRDVKPANVLVTQNDNPKLSDFGLSMIVDDAEASGVVRGTPHYMSPEQTRGSKLDYRTDLYSLGVMLYECATGGLPFTGGSLAIMTQHYSVEPDRPRARNSSVSEELDNLIMSLLAKRPDSRPVSGALVAQALREELDRIEAREHTLVDATSLGVKPLTTDPAATTMRTLVGQPGGPIATGGTGATSPSTQKPSSPAQFTGSSVATEPATPGSVAPAPSRPAAAVKPAAAPGGGLKSILATVKSDLVRKMLEKVLAEPVQLTPDERYLHGHYLAYLLGGSRRRGLFLRRPLEPRNADRGRMLLAMTYAILSGATDEAVTEATELLEKRIEVRPLLSPAVVAKYLGCRDTPSKRKVFRQTRIAIAEKSPYARAHMLDNRGILNPGLMPQKLEDLQLLAPPREEVDDVLVERWNRVADAWRNEMPFRDAVLKYVTKNAHRDPNSARLWPEVVYPLIERARWHRRVRNRTEVAWNYIWGRLLHLPSAGVGLDRAMASVMPAPLAAQIDQSFELRFHDFDGDDPQDDPFSARNTDEADRLQTGSMGGLVNLAELAKEERASAGIVQLVNPDPQRFFQSQLHEIWKEGVTALQSQAQGRGTPKSATQRHVAVGPYRLTVVPSFRGSGAGQVVIQGMANKQIEITTPTIRNKGSSSRPLLAIWTYRDNSLAIVHYDFVNTPQYVIWHASKGHHLKFEDPADFNHELYSLGLEIPDQLDRVLSRSFKPKNPV